MFGRLSLCLGLCAAVLAAAGIVAADSPAHVMRLGDARLARILGGEAQACMCETNVSNCGDFCVPEGGLDYSSYKCANGTPSVDVCVDSADSEDSCGKKGDKDCSETTIYYGGVNCTFQVRSESGTCTVPEGEGDPC